VACIRSPCKEGSPNEPRMNLDLRLFSSIISRLHLKSIGSSAPRTSFLERRSYVNGTNVPCAGTASCRTVLLGKNPFHLAGSRKAGSKTLRDWFWGGRTARDLPPGGAEVADSAQRSRPKARLERVPVILMRKTVPAPSLAKIGSMGRRASRFQPVIVLDNRAWRRSLPRKSRASSLK